MPGFAPTVMEGSSEMDSLAEQKEFKPRFHRRRLAFAKAQVPALARLRSVNHFEEAQASAGLWLFRSA